MVLKNILLTITFKGTKFHGFQVQKNAFTICECLQDAMFKLWRERPDVKGCSRTDSGVHALQYCLNFYYDLDMSLYKLPLALNAYLPDDIRVLQAVEVPMVFHARYNCIKKEYLYVFLNNNVDNPFQKGLYYRVSSTMDVEMMQKACAYFLGKHDFASFMSANSDIEDTVRTVYTANVEKKDNRIIFSVCADGFLYNMVRIMAGTLLNTALKRTLPEELPKILDKKNRSFAGDTLPAKGLFLNRVFYDDVQFRDIKDNSCKKGAYF